MGLRKKLKKALNCNNHIALTKEGIKKYDLREAIHSQIYECLCDHLDEYIPLIGDYEDVSSMLDAVDIEYEVEVADLKDKITTDKLLDYGFVLSEVFYRQYKVSDRYFYEIFVGNQGTPNEHFIPYYHDKHDNTRNELSIYPIEYMHQVKDIFRMVFNEELTRKEQE